MTNCERYEECGRDGFRRDKDGVLLCIPHLKGADLTPPKPKRTPRKRAPKKTTASKRASSRTPTRTTEAVSQTTEAPGEVTS